VNDFVLDDEKKKIYIYIYILSSTPELIPPEMLAVGCRMRAFCVAGGEELLAVS
jgi:hypothetical protein